LVDQVGRLVKCMPCVQHVWSLNPRPAKSDTVLQADLLHLLENTFDRKCIFASHDSNFNRKAQ